MWSPLRLVPLVGPFLLLALASNAWAGSTAVTKVGTNDRLTFTAKGGEANHVTLEQGATQLRLNDSGAQVTPPATVPVGVTCTASGANAVVCTGIEEAKLDLR